MTKKHTILVGSHISAAGGLYKAIERGQSIGCTAMQIFSKSNRTWFDKKITDQDAEAFKDAAKKSSIKTIVVHAGYLINVGSNKEETAKISVDALIDEVVRCQQLGLKYLVLHPGSHTGAGIEACIKQVAQNLDHIIEKSDGSVMILLETMAGQGTNIGSTFNELAQIRSLSHHKKNIGMCLDTCHVFAAGHDISTKDTYNQMIKSFDDIIGLEHLHAIHLNDSQTKLGSRVDRHAPVGQGSIPLQTFEWIMNDKHLVDIAKILETPSDPAMQLWKKEIELLKNMVDQI